MPFQPTAYQGHSSTRVPFHDHSPFICLAVPSCSSIPGPFDDHSSSLSSSTWHWEWYSRYWIDHGTVPSYSQGLEPWNASPRSERCSKSEMVQVERLEWHWNGTADSGMVENGTSPGGIALEGYSSHWNGHSMTNPGLE